MNRLATLASHLRCLLTFFYRSSAFAHAGSHLSGRPRHAWMLSRSRAVSIIWKHRVRPTHIIQLHTPCRAAAVSSRHCLRRQYNHVAGAGQRHMEQSVCAVQHLDHTPASAEWNDLDDADAACPWHVRQRRCLCLAHYHIRTSLRVG